MDTARHEIGEGRGAALVRHMHDVDAGHRLEQFGRQMRRAAEARRAVEELTGLRFGERDEFRHRFRRNIRIDRHQVRHPCDDGDRLDVLDRIVGHVLLNILVDRVGARRADDEGVAVRIGLGDEIGGDVAACARLVLDDELLAVFFRELLRHEAAENVGGAAGGERHDEFHRMVRPRCGFGRAAQERCGGKRRAACKNGAPGGSGRSHSHDRRISSVGSYENIFTVTVVVWRTAGLTGDPYSA